MTGKRSSAAGSGIARTKGGAGGGARTRLAAFLAIGAVALGQVSAPARADAPAGPANVEWRDGLLSVSADGVPLRALVEAVAVSTGAEVRGLSNIEGGASVRFENLALTEGLRALLGHLEYALVEVPSERDSGGAVVIVVGGRGAGLSPGTVHEPGAAAGTGARDDAAQRMAALERLAREDREKARLAAAEAARGDDPAERTVAVQVLGGLDSFEAANALGAALMDPDQSVRHAAVVALMGQTSPAATQLLTQALQDDAGPIRLLALEMLAQRGADGKPAVRGVLDDRDPAVRARAREVFGRMQPVD